MEIALGKYSSHYAQDLETMHVSWDTKAYLTSLPEVGFIAHHVTARGEIPVAAGFLRRVEGGFAQIDTLVSNASLPGAIRHVAISKVVDKLIAEAKSLGLRGLICLTKDEGTIQRALGLGFHIVPQIVIALPFEEITP